MRLYFFGVTRLLWGIRFSFPLQLLLIGFKKNLSLLLFWLFAATATVGAFGSNYGANRTILAPEYLGKTDFFSFAWVGISFGFFLTAWQIASYMLNSFRFPFLATLRRPFLHFCINNSLIPGIYIVVYIVAVFRYQRYNEFTANGDIFLYILGFCLGLLLTIVLFSIYFKFTNKDIESFRSRLMEHHPAGFIRKTPDWGEHLKHRNDRHVPVVYYINYRLQVRVVRGTEHYSTAALQAVFQQNHTNALFVMGLALVLVLSMSRGLDIRAFQLPAPASVLLLLSVLISLLGAFTYWLTGWRTIGLIIMMLILDRSTHFEWLNYKTPAFGLNYDCAPAIYNDSLLKEYSTLKQAELDKQNTIEILEKWKKKAQIAQGLSSDQKPDLLFLTFSGGGLRSTVWSTRVIQGLDSLLNGKLMDNAFMITGASGGMLAAAHLREIFYRQQTQGTPRLQDTSLIDRISQDLLNPILFSVAVNDLFIPIQKFKMDEHWYRKNRAYMFEKKWHENTDSIIANRTIADYEQAECDALIPMLIIAPTIISNAKKLVISPQPVSYLTRSTNEHGFTHSSSEVDGLELSFLGRQDGYKLLLSSAMRMSATYPLILPDTYLPTDVDLQVIDAGVRDNQGFESVFRTISVCRQWLLDNVDETIVVMVRDDQKDEILEYPLLNYSERFSKPIATFVSTSMQDYYMDAGLAMANEILDGKMRVLNFEYLAENKEVRATLSYHLTTREKRDIIQSFGRTNNQKSARQLLEYLKNNQIERQKSR